MGAGEDAGKKDDIRQFLDRVKHGQRFIEDIWVEREVKPRGSEGSGNLASSLSGRPISNITELLKDDIRYTFDDNLFAFRFIAAVPGSGKTTILDYLSELIKADQRYNKHSIVVSFSLNELLAHAGSKEFGVKLYSYILIQTFWAILGQDSQKVSNSIKEAAKSYLEMIFGQEKISSLVSYARLKIPFTSRLGSSIDELNINLRVFFFELIEYTMLNEPNACFVYLIDELDALHSHQDYLHDARSIIRDIINEAARIQKLRLMFYMVGNPDDVESFIKEDEALYSRVYDFVISLVSYKTDECKAIQKNIEDKLEGAYRSCNTFNKAWNEIRQIKLEHNHHYDSLRKFCKMYAERVIQIHEKHFQFFDKSFNRYEKKSRLITLSECLEKWKDFIGDQPTRQSSCEQQRIGYKGHNKWEIYSGSSGYSLLAANSTTCISNHNVDCYFELWHRGDCVARAYGEAKNYALLKEHISTFDNWLEDFNFSPDSNPSDLAFIVAPSCTELQAKKLKNKNISFLELAKIFDTEDESENEKDNVVNELSDSTSININNADEKMLKTAFKGARIRANKIKDVVEQRPFVDLSDMANRLDLTKNMISVLDKKISKGQIFFS